jgi:hypothetical protein
MAVNLGIGRILVESDAQEVVRAIKSGDYDLSAVGHLIDEIKSLLCSNFISFECFHVGRECNRAMLVDLLIARSNDRVKSLIVP